MLPRRHWIPVALVGPLLLSSCFTIFATATTAAYRDEIEAVRATDEGGLLFTIGPRRSLLEGSSTLRLEGPELEGMLGPGEPWPRASVSLERAIPGSPRVALPEIQATRSVPLQRGPPDSWSQPAPVGWSVVYSLARGDETRGEPARFELLVRRRDDGTPERGVILVLTGEPASAWDTLRGILAFSALDGVILLIASL